MTSSIVISASAANMAILLTLETLVQPSPSPSSSSLSSSSSSLAFFFLICSCLAISLFSSFASFFSSRFLLPYLLLLGNLPLLILCIFLLLLLGLLLRIFSLLQEHLPGVCDPCTKSIIAAAVGVAVGIPPVVTVGVGTIVQSCPGLLSDLLLLALAPRPSLVIAVFVFILLLVLLSTLIFGFWVKLGNIVGHALPHVFP